MKKIIFALFIGLFIGSTTTAIASGEYVQAIFSKFNFVVNDQEVELEADPLVYQGTTYLPVRVISNMLGYDLTYKSDSRTIELSSAPKLDEFNVMKVGESMIDGDFTETIYEGMKAVIYNSETYFQLKEYEDKYDTFQWGVNNETEKIFLGKTEGINPPEFIEILIEIDKNDSSSFVIYKGRGYINIKHLLIQ